MPEQPDPLTDALQALHDLIERYGRERTEEQHEMWWQVENAMEELAEQGIAEGRRQATEGEPHSAQDVEIVAAWFKHWFGASSIRKRDREYAAGVLAALDAAGRRLVGPWEPADPAPPGDVPTAPERPKPAIPAGAEGTADYASPRPICWAEHQGMLCDRTRGHIGDHVDIYGPLPRHTWVEPASGGVVEPSGPLTAEEATPDCVVPKP